MSAIVQRDKQPKGSGNAPAFQIRIAPELKESKWRMLMQKKG